MQDDVSEQNLTEDASAPSNQEVEIFYRFPGRKSHASHWTPPDIEYYVYRWAHPESFKAQILYLDELVQRERDLLAETIAEPQQKHDDLVRRRDALVMALVTHGRSPEARAMAKKMDKLIDQLYDIKKILKPVQEEIEQFDADLRIIRRFF